MIIQVSIYERGRSFLRSNTFVFILNPPNPSRANQRMITQLTGRFCSATKSLRFEEAVDAVNVHLYVSDRH